MRRSTSLPPRLAHIIFEAGPRKIVLVEGDDDEKIFKLWFKDHLDKLDFFECEGYQNVEDWVNIYLENSELKQVFGIRDRDFDYEDDDLVEEAYHEPNRHLFVLRRRCIESYLIVPELIFELGKMRMEDDLFVSSAPGAEQAIFDLVKSLKTLTAANWIIRLDNNQKTEGEIKVEYFSLGFPTHDRSIILNILSQKLNISVESTKNLLSEQETVVESYCSTLETSYKIIDGKRLLFHIRNKFGYGIKAGEKLFLNLLIDRILLKNKIHSDLKFIIEEKILKYPTTS